MDITVENHGTLFLLRAHTEYAKHWLSENLSSEAFWLGDAVACEPRYVVDIVEGARADGLEVG